MPKKIFLFFLAFNLYSLLDLNPLFCADQQEQEQKINEQESVSQFNQEMILSGKEELKKEREQKIAERKANIRSEKESAALKRTELRQERQEEKARDIANAPWNSSPVADYICDLGIAAYKSGEYRSALLEFERALLIEPDNPTALKYIENALYKIEQSRRVLP